MKKLSELAAILLCLAPLTSLSAPASDARALALVAQASAALSKGAPVTDLLATGSAVWVVGPGYVTGTAILKVKGLWQSSLSIEAPGFSRTEVRDDTNGPNGQWTGTDSVRHRIPLHNNWTIGAWYAPTTIISVLGSEGVSVTYVAEEVRDGLPMDHIRLYRSFIDKRFDKVADLGQVLSATDVYLDALSHLPLVVVFQTHPDNDLHVNIPVEVRFADYRNVNGLLFPFRIQRLLQSSLNLDITVTNVTANSGLSDSDFALH